MTPAVRAGSASSCEEGHEHEHGTLLPKRTTAEQPDHGQTSSVTPDAVGQELPKHRRTGSGASSRGKQDSNNHHRRSNSHAALKAAKYGQPTADADKTLSAEGTAGLLVADDQDEDDDCCPTCLEVYTQDNPKIFTRCGHHFHMQCIYEWLERKDTCPLCESKMVFEDDLLLE
eukprot:jgi/Chrzof1/10996/Cz05g19290.t1